MKRPPSSTPEYRRAYRAAHRAEFAARRKPLVGRARERHRKYMHEYYRKNKHRIDKEKARQATLRHYYKHKDRLLAQTRERQQIGQQMIDEAKSRPCMDCGIQYPTYIMDFDHVRGVKRFYIGGAAGRSLKTLGEEIAKCDVVCSNCHRERTHRRQR